LEVEVNTRHRSLVFLLILTAGLIGGSCGPAPQSFDAIIRNGTVYDGSGEPGVVADVGITGDRVAAVGDLGRTTAAIEIDAGGLAVAPGFVNMMSWATESLIEDGRSQSDIRQGVTLEVMGEGFSMGPLSDAMKEEVKKRQKDLTYDIEWTTLGEYLHFLERRGVSPNVASFVGATSARLHVIGYDDREPTAAELDEMKQLVRHAMEEGAVGLSSALIYPPGSFAKTGELIELAKVAAEYDGLYISHMRSEGNRLLEAIDELLTIAREAQIRAEIYHLKTMGQNNWHKMEQAIAKVEQARDEGMHITADAYTYTAGGTGLMAAMPTWIQDGGREAALERLADPATRRRVTREMLEESDDWENLYLAAGSPDNILLAGFSNEELRPLTGKSLAEVAGMRGTPPEETAVDLVLESEGRVSAVYFLMSEDNLRMKFARPWVSFCSDAASIAPEGMFLKRRPHPRAYGSFARLLGRYVREEGVLPLEEAIRRLTSLPVENLRIEDRGRLREGFYADVVVFDPEIIQDHATFAEPHRYSTGMVHVFVNGVQVLADGEHTEALPGRVVHGPGWTGWGE
jgi:N-acyl-D-amino-acid deacylase